LLPFKTYRSVSTCQQLTIRPKAKKGDKTQVGAPMPGTVLDVRVKPGDDVSKGDKLVVLSAMKMEMVVQAPNAGKVKEVHVGKDDSLQGGDLIITLE
jgi:pyruvate carboxylase